MLATTEAETLNAFSMLWSARETKVNAVHFEVFQTHLYIILQCLQQKLLQFENRKHQDLSFSPDAGALNPQNAICIGGSVHNGTVCLQMNSGTLFSAPVD